MKLNKLILTGITFSSLTLMPISNATALENKIYEAENKNSVQDNKHKTNEKIAKQSESLSMEEINDKEGIPQEQIIVSIDSEGYVTSHGDHFHYYNGNPTGEVLFSEDIQTEEDYQYSEADLISEIEGGKIVLVDGNYLVYNELGEDHPGLRHVEEIYLQSFSVHPEDAFQLFQLKKEYELPEDSKIFYEVDRSLEQLFEELQSKDSEITEPTLIYITEEEYAVILGIDIYIFPGQPNENINISELFLISEDLDIQDKEKAFESNLGTVYKIDQKNRLMLNKNLKITTIHFDHLKNEVSRSLDNFLKAHGKRLDSKYENVSGKVLHESGTRNGSGKYMTDDGYVFSPYDVIRDTGTGFIVPHDDHFHFIPKSDLTAEEIAIAMKVLGNGSATKTPTNTAETTIIKEGEDAANSQNSSSTKTNHNKPSTTDRVVIKISKSKRYHDNKPYTTSDGYVFSPESITEIDIEGHGIVGKHEDHFHFVPFSDLNKSELERLKVVVKEKWGYEIILPGEEINHPVTNPSSDEDKTDKNEKNQHSDGSEASNFKFDYKKVIDKLGEGEEAHYILNFDGKKVQIPVSSLNLQNRAFAEMQLSIVKENYPFAVINNKKELEPKLYIPASKLPMHAGNATIDTGKAFIIPHIDHLHWVYYNQLTAEEIATVKFLMQNPIERPEPWTEKGHGKSDMGNYIGTIPNVTPLEEREKMKNSDIIHSKEEVEKALLEGKYATPEGYIYSPKDVLNEGTKFYLDSVTIRFSDGSFHDISFKKMTDSQRQETINIIKEHRLSSKYDKLDEKSTHADEEIENKPTNNDIMEFLANHYEVDRFYVTLLLDTFTITKNDESITIPYEVALKAYQGAKEVLPVFTLKNTQRTFESSSVNTQDSNNRKIDSEPEETTDNSLNNENETETLATDSTEIIESSEPSTSAAEEY